MTATHPAALLRPGATATHDTGAGAASQDLLDALAQEADGDPEPGDTE